MEIRPIRTKADYKDALRAVSAYFDDEPEPGTPDGDRFEVLLTLVEAYEAKNFPIDLPDPVEAIKFRMEQGGLTPKDLVPAIGRLKRNARVLYAFGHAHLGLTMSAMTSELVLALAKGDAPPFDLAPFEIERFA